MDEPTIAAGDCQKVGQALGLLGAAYRYDWSDFDGRTLRAQLDELAAYLTGEGKGFDLEDWAFTTGICPVSRVGTEHCDKKTDRAYDCQHLVEYYNKKETVKNA